MRRRVVSALAIVVAVIGTARGRAAQQPTPDNPTPVPPNSATIHQEVDFAVSPRRLYEALLDSTQFTAFSGRPAEIRREAGGAFSLFGGHIVGRNVELVPGLRIVQAWRVSTWPDGTYSIARFELLSQGSGTRLVFDQAGFPEELRDQLAKGWNANYWDVLKKYFQ